MSVVARSVTVMLFAVTASFLISSILLPMIGAPFSRTAIIMCIVCPALISFPICYRNYKVRTRLQAVHARLEEAHERLAAAHRLLAEKARRDEMTGLLNRETFFRDMATARSEHVASHLLMIDADNFKDINDTHGHLVGDDALKAIASTIRSSLRSEDLVARIGGEEFAAYLPGADILEAHRLAEAVRRAVEAIDLRTPTGERVPLTVSIGAAADSLSATLTDLVRSADRRLYEAKRAGRNRTVFESLSRAA
jgi:diguanylate cyclase (GGDEF)-like protein